MNFKTQLLIEPVAGTLLDFKPGYGKIPPLAALRSAEVGANCHEVEIAQNFPNIRYLYLPSFNSLDPQLRIL